LLTSSGNPGNGQFWTKSGVFLKYLVGQASLFREYTPNRQRLEHMRRFG
jgi:hypothetical protein